MVFGSMLTNKMTIANGAAGEYALAEFVSTEKKLVLVPEADAVLHLLLTPSGSDTDADAEDLLIPASGLELEVGRALDRISVYNASGSEKSLYVGVFF